jgi:lytic cellulose monooxygenase (C1-hydroxylating)
MIANQGWHYFTMPSCIAPGQYLMRTEIIALHSASIQGQAQFYMECAQYVSISCRNNKSCLTDRVVIRIAITGSGTTVGSNTVSFPGAYSATDPGILISIYDSAGQPNGGGRPYQIPGPAVLSCATGGSSPQSTPAAGTTTPAGTTTTTPAGTTTKPAATSTSAPSTSTVALYGQCGGQGWNGATTCVSGTCKVSNQYYSKSQSARQIPHAATMLTM